MREAQRLGQRNSTALPPSSPQTQPAIRGLLPQVVDEGMPNPTSSRVGDHCEFGT